MLGVAHAHCSVVDRHRCREQWRRHAHLAQRGADELHVLLPHRHLHRRGLPAALFHERAAHLQHARPAGAVGQHARRIARADAPALAQQQGLGGGDVVDGDQQVRHQLHLHAVAEGAEMELRFREALEHRLQAFDHGRGATRVDGQVLAHRLRAGARQRAVQQHDAGCGQHATRGLLVSDVERAGLHDRQATRGGGGQLLRRGHQGLATRQ